MRRVYYVSLLVCLSLLTLVSTMNAQTKDRRGEPNALSTGYYVVDSDDNAPTPWRPQYFFLDTTYNRTEWTQIWTGPQQYGAPGQFFFDPRTTVPSLMDTVNDCMAGPIYMRLGHQWNFYNGNYDSVYISSNGFIGFRPYNEATAGSPPAYSRGNNVDLKTSFASAPHAIVAGLWADLDMRHGGPHDTSIVYYRTSTSLDTFFVNYYNFRLKPGGNNTFAPYGWSAPGADRLFCKKFQIVLANTDSSIQVNYGGFSGSINGFPPILAYAEFEGNAAIGLTNENGTQATSVLYGKRGSGKWDAVNPTCRSCNKEWSQSKQWAIKFKRWHNIVRSIAVTYPPRNYEICLGTSITPKATFKNVDSMTQNFKVRFAIRNVVTGIAVYSRVVSLLNMLPGSSRDTFFAPYATNPNILSQLGTFNACAIATTYDTADVNIGDRWPFDDTVCTSVFGVRRTAVPYRDPSNNYSKTVSADIPDQTLWISIGTQVVEGEDATWDPPPPRDLNGAGYGADGFHSPAIQFDRTDINGNTYNGGNVGDTLLSFPINLQGKTKANLSFDFQRAGKIPGGYPWLFDGDVMLGPEHTVLNALNLSVMRPGDSMVVEFKKPSEPGCNPSTGGWNYITAIDGGHDFEFKKFFMSMTPSQATINIDELQPKIINGFTNYFTADFRFRLRLKAKYDAAFIPPPNDDADPWYVDNPTVLVPLKPEIEVMWVRVVNPFSKIPASQAVSLPVYVKVANMSTNVSIAFPIKVQILDPSGSTVYWQTVTVNSLLGGTDSVIQMPNWNAQNTTAGGGATYVIHAWLDQPGYDSYSDDDGTYTKFDLNVEQGDQAIQEFAYDDAGLTPGQNSGNDWPGITQLVGQGVGFSGNNGSFAMKFKLATKDTLYGVRVYFANANQSPDALRLSILYGDPATCTPGDTVLQEGVQSTMLAQRGGGYYNQFWPYYFPHPIILTGGADAGSNKGIYWLSVSQLSINNMMMGADVSRGGGLIRQWDPQLITPHIDPIYNSKYGTQWKSTETNTGDISCVWALEVTAGSGSWAPWTPNVGWWPTNGNAGLPLSWRTNPNPGYMIDAGSYTPMIRPMVSQSVLLPVNLLYLNGEQQNGAALLTWATSKEVDNAGFYIERKNVNVPDEMYTKIGYVSAGEEKTTSTEKGYGYIDRNVTPGSYSYRLIQMDVNGAQHVSNTVQVQIDAPKNFSLEQNYPNPFMPDNGSRTQFSYTVPVAGPASMVVYNQLGEVVKTIVAGNVEVGSHTASWDGKDEGGNIVAAGTYICKLISGENASMIKMTVTR